VSIASTEPSGSERREHAEYEEPVDFVRVIPEQAEVLCTIEGWPAAFRMSYGSGRILVTTLAALAARMEPRYRLAPRMDARACWGP